MSVEFALEDGWEPVSLSRGSASPVKISILNPSRDVRSLRVSIDEAYAGKIGFFVGERVRFFKNEATKEIGIVLVLDSECSARTIQRHSQNRVSINCAVAPFEKLIGKESSHPTNVISASEGKLVIRDIDQDPISTAEPISPEREYKLTALGRAILNLVFDCNSFESDEALIRETQRISKYANYGSGLIYKTINDLCCHGFLHVLGHYRLTEFGSEAIKQEEKGSQG